jgi:hypothetical protein
MDTITAKLEIARSVRKQSQALSEFQIAHWNVLGEVDRLELAVAIQKLDARAADLLHDALEEGAAQAEELIVRMNASTESIRDATSNVERVGEVLAIATKVAKAAAAVVSGGIQPALRILV